MSEKCRKRPISKNKDIKAARHFFKKMITKGMTYTQTATKSIGLFKAYACLKSLPPIHSSFFTSFLIPVFSILISCKKIW